MESSRYAFDAALTPWDPSSMLIGKEAFQSWHDRRI